MRRPASLLLVLALLVSPAGAAERLVQADTGALVAAIAGASPGDTLILSPGRHDGPVTIDKPLTLQGQPGAEVDANGSGSVITVTAEDAVVRGLIVTGSGSRHQEIDAGIHLTRTSARVLVEANTLRGNLHGIVVHGSRDSIVRRNVIEGRLDHRMNDRGNGVYVWNAPGAAIEGNDIRWGRDGIFANASRKNTFTGNLFRDLRFAVHYMYTHDSTVTDNVSIGNHLGFALMFSDRITVTGNLSLRDRGQGLMLNFANQSDVAGNLVRGGAEKCLFVYNAHRNLIAGNRFEGCEIGLHFTAGSERNGLTGNAFIGNRTQVKYVGTRDMEWSLDGRGNHWSDHPAFDLDGDGIADGVFRPNDLMDHILWSQPAAALLMGSPAVQLIRWSQAHFPATLPGGVVDSFPLMQAPEVPVHDHIAAMEAAARPAWAEGDYDAELDALTDH